MRTLDIYGTLIFSIAAALLLLSSVSALPEGWKITEFAAPPQVHYPTAISAAANGDIYVSVDENGSLSKNPNFGKIVRATDTNSDGKADQFQDYVPNVTSPRGGHMVADTFYLIHPPYLSAYQDKDGDGVAEEKKTLVTGFGWGIEHPPGADHTTNGVRMGIDGWLYVAVGDFGMPAAKGADGTSYTLQGGGVIRVRPDGSEMEPYSTNIRNIYDIAITPTLDMFSRDNTNDGKGWNTRLHHFTPMGDHGYPKLYKNFPEETIIPLADYGGGSGTGALSLNEPGFPKEYDNAIFTCDWTTGNIYHHQTKPMEATFEITQEIFHPLTRATDIDVDGESRLYLADWRNGKFKYDATQKVGKIHQVLPPGWQKTEFPDLKNMPDAALAEQLRSDSAVMRLEAQQEMLSRGPNETFSIALTKLMSDQSAHLFKRVAAIFTYKQILGNQANKTLETLTKDQEIREYILRALADRKTQLENISATTFEKYLNDENPRVRLQAINGLARLRANDTAPAILKSLANADLNPGSFDSSERRVIPHVAIKALVTLNSAEACLTAISDSSTRPLAFRALQEMHTETAVDGLIAIAEKTTDQELLTTTLSTLARLHFKEKKWNLKSWWNTRPDDRGPYYDPVPWAATDRIRTAIEKYFVKLEKENQNHLIIILAKNRLPLSELKLAGLDPVLIALANDEINDATLNLLLSAAAEPNREWPQRLAAYKALERADKSKVIHAQIKTLATWLTQKHPEAQNTVVDFVNQTQRGYEIPVLNQIAKNDSDTESMIAWKSMLTVLNSPLSEEPSKEDVRKILSEQTMEVGFFLAIADMKLSGFEKQITAGIESDNDKTIIAAQRAKEAGASATQTGTKVAEMTPQNATAHAIKNKGDPKNGERLYVSQGCIACHAVDINAVQKGPYLGASGAKFERDYLIESIIAPNAVVAQGFQTVVFSMNDGTSKMGFVTNEADDIIDIRDIAGQVSQIKRSEVKNEQTLPQSMMPAGLANSLSIEDFTDLIEYLVSLKNVGG